MPSSNDVIATWFEPLSRVKIATRHPALQYALAAAVIGLAFLAHRSIAIVLPEPPPFMLFFPAIMLAAVMGGLGPGLLACVLSLLAAHQIVGAQPVSAASIGVGSFVLFAMTSALVVVLLHLLSDAFGRISLHERFAAEMLEGAPAGIIAVDRDGIIVLANSNAAQIFGYRGDELLGSELEVLVPESYRVRHRIDRQLYSGAPVSRPMGKGTDLVGCRKDGTQVPVEIALGPFVRHGSMGAIATIVDISERKAAEQRQSMLAREVQHRGRNLLTVVQAMATRTLVDGRSMAECRAQFIGRLQAIARTQEILAHTGSADLGHIIRSELVVYDGQADIAGEPFVMQSTAAQNFTLILHELATNALKYGAFSTSEGRVTVRWSVVDGALRLQWDEAGGPPVHQTGPPGFGSTILEQVPTAMGARVERRFLPAGLIYAIEIDARSLNGAAIAPRGPTLTAQIVTAE